MKDVRDQSVRVAASLAASGQYAAAHSLLNAAEGADNAAEARLLRGKILAQQGLYDAAIAEWQSVLAKVPNHAEAQQAIRTAQELRDRKAGPLRLRARLLRAACLAALLAAAILLAFGAGLWSSRCAYSQTILGVPATRAGETGSLRSAIERIVDTSASHVQKGLADAREESARTATRTGQQLDGLQGGLQELEKQAQANRGALEGQTAELSASILKELDKQAAVSREMLDSKAAGLAESIRAAVAVTQAAQESTASRLDKRLAEMQQESAQAVAATRERIQSLERRAMALEAQETGSQAYIERRTAALFESLRSADLHVLASRMAALRDAEGRLAAVEEDLVARGGLLGSWLKPRRIADARTALANTRRQLAECDAEYRERSAFWDAQSQRFSLVGFPPEGASR